MKEEKMMDAMDGIGDDLVNDWEKESRGNKRSPRMKKLLSVAACILVTLLITATLGALGVQQEMITNGEGGISIASVFSGTNLYLTFALVALVIGAIETVWLLKKTYR